MSVTNKKGGVTNVTPGVQGFQKTTKGQKTVPAVKPSVPAPAAPAIVPVKQNGWDAVRTAQKMKEKLVESMLENFPRTDTELVAFTDKYAVVAGRFDGYEAYDPRDEETFGVFFTPGRGNYSHYGDKNDVAKEVSRVFTETYDGEYEDEGYPPGYASAVQHLKDKFGTTTILPVSVYDHSSQHVFVGHPGDALGDSAGWDTSQIGFIVDTRETRETFGVTEDDVEAQLTEEISAYDDYINGEYDNYLEVWEHDQGTLVGEEDRWYGVRTRDLEDEAKTLLGYAGGSTPTDSSPMVWKVSTLPA